LVGSSLGGFYATYFAEQYNLKAVLINPAVHAHQLITPGYWKNELTGEETYFTPMMQEALAQMDVKYLSYPEHFFSLLKKAMRCLTIDRRLLFMKAPDKLF